MPAARHSSRSPSSTWVVTATIGTRRPLPLDLGGKLGSAHTLDALPFGLVAFGLVNFAGQLIDGLVGGFPLAFQFARLAGMGLPLGGVLVVVLSLAAALAGAPFDGRGRWPQVLRWSGV